jgi:hypothetical protein
MTTINTRASDAAREAAGDAHYCELCGERIALHGDRSHESYPGEPVGRIGLVRAHQTCYEAACQERGNHVHSNE